MTRPPYPSARLCSAADDRGRSLRPSASQGFAAFQLLYEHKYLRYAQERLGSLALGHGAVVAAFSALSAIWAEVLGRSCPGTVSWQVLGHTVSAVRSASVCPSIDVDALYEVLPVLQADAVLLRDRLGMSLSGAADLMGVDESALVVLQRLADRSLDEA